MSVTVDMKYNEFDHIRDRRGRGLRMLHGTVAADAMRKGGGHCRSRAEGRDAEFFSILK